MSYYFDSKTLSIEALVKHLSSSPTLNLDRFLSEFSSSLKPMLFTGMRQSD
jgi:hypothetical protein